MSRLLITATADLPRNVLRSTAVIGVTMVELTRLIPREHVLESGPSLLRDGYEFIAKRARLHGSDVFQTRLMFQDTICLTGENGAKLFYDTTKFQRTKAAPIRAKRSLFGVGGIQGTDGAQHRARKQMFMSMMTPDRIARLVREFEDGWRAALPHWALCEIELFTAVRQLLVRAVCEWCGVPLDRACVVKRAHDIEAVIDGSGGVGPRHWRSRLARRRCDAWMRSVVREARSGQRPVSPDSPLQRVIEFREANGEPLDAHTAGVELFNFIRPTVAVDRFITFAALALHDHPETRAALNDGDDRGYEHFVQEVRRYYPFFPFTVARVSEAFNWGGYRFPKGTRTLLDIYGTDHDPRIWGDPEMFRPDRFRTWNGSAFNFIPQGGGDHLTGHRCPGEWITIELMKAALRMLTREMSYEVPPQDLSFSLRRIPSIPRSRFIIANVQRRGIAA